MPETYLCNVHMQAVSIGFSLDLKIIEPKPLEAHISMLDSKENEKKKCMATFSPDYQ